MLIKFVDVAVATKIPPRKIWYPKTVPESSVEADHETLIWLEVFAVAVTLRGTDGGVVSGVSVVALESGDGSEIFPAKSNAVTL